jgi:hypothetical protein
MAAPRKSRPSHSALGWWAGLAIAALGQSAAIPAHAEMVPMAVYGAGNVVTQPQCAAIAQAVWVTAMGRQFCMRYYLSTAGGEGSRPVLFLQGDAPGTDLETTDSLFKYADQMSVQQKTTAIYLARMGRDGSSGSHDDRHTVLELQVTNAAMEAIKRRYKYEGFHVYGHSGGGNLVAGLLGLRKDLACAVPADGQLAELRQRKTSDPALQAFVASDTVATIAQNRSARVLVVTDPQDRTVPLHMQLPFVEALRKAGGQVEHFFVDSGGDATADHHFTTPHAALVMQDCIRGAGYTEIAADLADLVAKRLKGAVAAAAAKAEKEATTKNTGSASK